MKRDSQTAISALAVVIAIIALVAGNGRQRKTATESLTATDEPIGVGRTATADEQTAETETCENGVKYRVTEYAETESKTEIETESETETETETEAQIEAENAPEQYDDDAVMIAKTIAVEAPYCSTVEQAAVAWCILNRVDDPRYPDTVSGNLTIYNPRQFGYFPDTPLRDDLYALALDVLERYEREKNGEVNVGRVLPQEYLYFWGDGQHNHFRVGVSDQIYWDWSAANPYEVIG